MTTAPFSRDLKQLTHLYQWLVTRGLDPEDFDRGGAHRDLRAMDENFQAIDPARYADIVLAHGIRREEG
ncbi:hypothetical protein [Kocuria rosea]|uniref:hypothetical protein n=1 Tax=Kocuria rosea TaxID=1275 RepID=UPI00203F8F20|nr:hypothetical protein [Kocuria rosea]MCM3687692.1 hypothetical protein [Kocuria rosea]